MRGSSSLSRRVPGSVSLRRGTRLLVPLILVALALAVLVNISATWNSRPPSPEPTTSPSTAESSLGHSIPQATVGELFTTGTETVQASSTTNSPIIFPPTNEAVAPTAIAPSRRPLRTAPESTVVLNTGSFSLPYVYPMHQHLPERKLIEQGILSSQLSKHRVERCMSRAPPVFFDPPASYTVVRDPARSAALEREYDFENPSGEVFYADAAETLTDAGRPWWVPAGTVRSEPDKNYDLHGAADDASGFDRIGAGLDYGTNPDGEYDALGSLPCTEEVQRRLWLHQHPKSCEQSKFLVSRLKEGAHGIGSAVTLVAHDFLSAMILGRVLVMDSRAPWYFSPSSCGDSRRGWDCLFAPPTHCPVPSTIGTVGSRAEAERSSSPALRKKSFDINGLSRDDMPAAERFFGMFSVATRGSCYTAVKRWLRDPANTYVMGTFAKGADPLMSYMLAQVTRYLMRAPQPWFKNMLQYHLAQVQLTSTRGRDMTKLVQKAKLPDAALPPPQPGVAHSAMLVYVQDRGEIAKYREYYNAFGCHTVRNSIFTHFVKSICDFSTTVLEGSGLGAQSRCAAYISGNTPVSTFKALVHDLQTRNIPMLSTWKHPRLGLSQETDRWGASAAFASWVDLYAGVAAGGWVCTVQSNWCRVINFLRLTSGRAQCPFVDVGALMISSATARKDFCVVKHEWPRKPFGGRIK